jgi:hypothetical protein
MTDARYTVYIDEAYRNYCNTYPDAEKTFQYEGSNIEVRKLTHEEFINECQTDPEFSERWGLKIEIKELTRFERCDWLSIYRTDLQKESMKYDAASSMAGAKSIHTEWLGQHNIPTKLITITYKEQKIESYE